MSEQSKYLTSFVTPQGQSEWLRMPFGLSTAPQTFTRAISKLLEGLRHVHIYIDDILIATESAKSHFETVREVLARLKKHSIKCNTDKSEFMKKTDKFLRPYHFSE